MNRATDPPRRPRPVPPANPRRAGWTLLETLVAQGLLLLIMTLTGLLVAALSRAERNAVRSCVTQQSLSRLDELFRRDVHQALSATVTKHADQPDELLLELSPDSQVRYSVAAGNLQRTATSPGKKHHETYRLPNARWAFQVTEGDVRKVILKCQQPADTSPQTSPGLTPLRELNLQSILSLYRTSAPTKGGRP